MNLDPDVREVLVHLLVYVGILAASTVPFVVLSWALWRFWS